MKNFMVQKIRIGENYQAMIPGMNSVNSQPIDLGVLQLRRNEILLWKCLNDSDDFQLDLMRYFQRYGEISGQAGLVNGKIDDATVFLYFVYELTDSLICFNFYYMEAIYPHVEMSHFKVRANKIKLYPSRTFI